MQCVTAVRRALLTGFITLVVGVPDLAADVAIRVVSGRPDMVTGGSALVEVAGVETLSGSSAVSITVNGRHVTGVFRAATIRRTAARACQCPDPGQEHAGGSRSREARGAHRADQPSNQRTGLLRFRTRRRSSVRQRRLASVLRSTPTAARRPSSRTYISRRPRRPAHEVGGGPIGGRGAAPPPAAAGARGANVPPAAPTAPAGFRPYEPAAGRPADLAQTTTTDGHIVDYIVRRERGTINRAVYEIAFLHVPGQPLPDPWTRAPGWNGRLVYTFGGGCRAGYRQGQGASATSDTVLAGGYAMAASTLNVFGTTCDDVISAETMMMVKEHFIKQFGAPIYTIGTGGSGGAMQQHLDRAELSGPARWPHTQDELSRYREHRPQRRRLFSAGPRIRGSNAGVVRRAEKRRRWIRNVADLRFVDAFVCTRLRPSCGLPRERSTGAGVRPKDESERCALRHPR